MSRPFVVEDLFQLVHKRLTVLFNLVCWQEPVVDLAHVLGQRILVLPRQLVLNSAQV